MVRQCNPRIPRPQENDAPDQVVYFLRHAPDGLVKIGTTTDLQRRLTDLRAMSPVPIVVLATVPGGYETENLLHRMLAGHRHHGEWFSPVPDVLVTVSAAQMVARVASDYDQARHEYLTVLRHRDAVSTAQCGQLAYTRGQQAAAVHLARIPATPPVHPGEPVSTRLPPSIHRAVERERASDLQ